MTAQAAEQTLMTSVDPGLAEISPVQGYEQLPADPVVDTAMCSAWSLTPEL